MANRRKGFTLAELLIVVAIVGVLVAVSIPVFTNQLEKAKIATDQANVRSAKAAAIAEYLSTGTTGEVKYYYNAGSGTVQMSADGIKGYGKYTKNDKADLIGAEGYPNRNGNAQIVIIVINDSDVTMTWGESYGSIYRNRILSVGSSDTNDYSQNKQLKAKYLNMSNADRIEADQDILNSIADYFEHLTATEAKAILGTKKYNDSKGGTQLFIYAIDNTSASIRIDYPGNDVSYLSQLGYSTKTYSGSTMTDVPKNYMTQYLFSSDEMIGTSQTSGAENSIRIKLQVDESSNKVVAARVWGERKRKP